MSTKSAAFLQAVFRAYEEQRAEFAATMTAAESAGYDPMRVATMFAAGVELAGIRRALRLTVPGYANSSSEAARVDDWVTVFTKASPPKSS